MNPNRFWTAVLVGLLSMTAARVPAAEPSPPRHLSVSGQVVGPDGKPVAGATVYLRQWTFRSVYAQTVAPSDILATAPSDDQGRFAFREVAWPPLKPIRDPGLEDIFGDLVATARGYGLAWHHLASSGQEPQPVLLKLTPEAKLQGRLVDRAGKPAAGVRMQVAKLQPLDQPLEMSPYSEEFLNLFWSQVSLAATSDAEGQFILGGLPPNVRVGLLTFDPRFVGETYYAATTDQPQPNLSQRHYGGGQRTTTEVVVHTDRFTLTLQPGYSLRGQVVFQDTGQPAAGALLALMTTTEIRTIVTDAGGRYTLSQLSPGKYPLGTSQPEKTDYLGVQDDVVIPTDKREVEHNIQLPRGIPVAGRVVEEETGKGIPGAGIGYQNTSKGPPRWFSPRNVLTDAEGRFRLAVPPGPGQVGLYGGVPGYLTHREPPAGSQVVFSGIQLDKNLIRTFDAKPGEKIPEVNFTLSRGLVVTGRLLDPKGEPVAGANIVGPQSNATSDAAGRFTLSGMEPERSYEVFITHPERNLGGKVMVSSPKGKKSVAMEVKLEPTGSVAGRVLDEDKKPIARAQVQLWVMSPRTMAVNYGTASSSIMVRTNPDGTFRIDHLMPGGQFNLSVSASGHAGVSSSLLEAHAGQTEKMPDFTLVRADLAIAGVVLDPAGQPVGGVQVSASPALQGNNLSGAWQASTDAEGRFRIKDLPRGSVRLSAYPPQAGPGPSHQVSMQVAAGKQDVRLILPRSPKEGPPEAVVGKPAPEFPVRKWLNRKDTPAGRGFVREDFRGQMVVLAFLDEAKPSQRLLPRLDQLQARWAGKGLVIVRVYEVGTGEETLGKLSPTQMAQVAPGLIPGGYSPAFQKYGIRATPTLFLIDREGILRQADVEVEELEKVIAGLLKS